jgi:hypothetical protein
MLVNSISPTANSETDNLPEIVAEPETINS